MMEDKDYRIVGMMSGTSLDGVDLAFCHFVYRNSWEYTLIAAKTYPYPPEIIEHIHKMQQESTTFLAFKKLEILYSEHLSHVIKQFISDHDLKNIDYISLHGHTIYHQPKQKITIQIANLSTIAALLKMNVIGNFRQLDVMSDGQGAPLAPYGQQLFGDQIYLNFGGIANIGFRSSGWDINYCNLVFNHYAKKLENAQFDKDGKMGRKGNLNEDLKLFLHNNFQNRGLISLGREGFELLIKQIESNFLNLQEYDILHTFYVFLAEQINRNVESILNMNKVPMREEHEGEITVFCTGGGAKNTFLLELLQEKADKAIKYFLPDEKVIDFKQAIIFAFLGLKFILGIENCACGVGGMLVKGAKSICT